VPGIERANVPPLPVPVWRHEGRGSQRLKELEEENKRLKKLLAEAELDKAIKEALKGN
jgi:hypothetical protein